MPKELLGEKLYTIEEVAGLMSVTTRTIQNWLMKERIQAQKIGRRWYFTEDNLKAFIQGKEPNN